jgi:glycosyltransferase involved in cell wall biosynthesis
VVTCHGGDLYFYDPPSALYRLCSRVVDHWVFVSEQLRQRFFRQDISAEVLPAGIHSVYGDVPALPPMQKDIDLLYVGTLDFNKGMDRLLALLQQLPGLRVVVIGHGPWLSQLQQAQADYPGLELLGAKSPAELADYYRRARVYLNLSRNESFGLVMTEAMACGTPVVASQTDGAQAQLVDATNGFVVPQQDVTPMAQALAEKIQLLFSMSAAEYQHIQQRCQTSAQPYLLHKIANRLQTIYQSLV